MGKLQDVLAALLGSPLHVVAEPQAARRGEPQFRAAAVNLRRQAAQFVCRKAGKALVAERHQHVRAQTLVRVPDEASRPAVIPGMACYSVKTGAVGQISEKQA